LGLKGKFTDYGGGAGRKSLCPIFTGQITNGGMTFTDLNKDGKIDDNDQILIGNAMPNMSFSLSNKVVFHKFDFNIMLRSYSGHALANNLRYQFEIDNIKNGINSVRTPFYLAGQTYARYSDRTIEKASFANIDNVTIGYTIPFKQGGSKLRVYLSSENLHTFTKYTGNNPEPRFYARFGNTNTLDMGLDLANTYPMTRSFALGLTASF
jgi:TonB-dependent starch-binding outer membrane protein SusC